MLGYERKQAVKLTELLIETIKKNFEAENDLLVSRFGKFTIQNKKERKGRNPATGEKMMLDKRRIITFKCSNRLKDKMNNLPPKNYIGN